jgi:bla regulator protein BlaR1
MHRLILLAALLSMELQAQPTPVPLTFDVASIKPSSPDAHGTSLQFQPPNGLRISNGPLKMLITFAYDVRDFQVSGDPGWVGSDRFDILAKADRNPGKDIGPADFRRMNEEQRMAILRDMRERVRALLADRFHLSIHKETKQGSVYALIVAKGGPKMQLAKDTGEGQQGMRLNRGQLTGMVAPMEMLATVLSSQLGRPVLDKTELTGKYDFKLEWTPDVGEGGGPLGPKNPGDEPPPASPDGPTLFTALQEQLGLKLESQKGPIEMIVIDRVEKPSEN